MGGLLYLFCLVNALTGALAALTLGTYLFAYTPLKRVTTLNTLVGAIPGALPPVIGWAAARGALGAGAWALFAILFLLADAAFPGHRVDVPRGLRAGRASSCCPTWIETGASTGRQAVNYSFALLLVSLMPTLLGMAGRWYFFGAFVLGAGMIYLRRAAATPPPAARTRGSFSSPRSFTCRCCWRCWRRARSSVPAP